MTADPSDDVAGPLYVAFARLVRWLRQSAEGASPGPGGTSVMLTLSRTGPLRLSDLAAVEGISAPSLSRIVKALEEAGLVERAADPADGRAQLVDLTTGGATLIASGLEARMTALRARIAELDEADRAALAAAVPALERLSMPAQEIRSAQDDDQTDDRRQHADR